MQRLFTSSQHRYARNQWMQLAEDQQMDEQEVRRTLST